MSTTGHLVDIGWLTDFDRCGGITGLGCGQHFDYDLVSEEVLLVRNLFLAVAPGDRAVMFHPECLPAGMAHTTVLG